MDISQVCQPRASRTWGSVRLGSPNCRLRPLVNNQSSTNWESATRPMPSAAVDAGTRNRPPSMAIQHSSRIIE
ncbi:hypothetical protein D3C77_666340 [compost metagenome]